MDAGFIRRSDVLLVTFDNLGTVGRFDPPQPWIASIAAKAGFSILGVMAQRKDWYRNEDTPRLIRSLRDAGLFNEFRRIVFAGASMGGFAALAYSALVPGSVALAFSPQSSLAHDLAPFDRRYRQQARMADWQTPAFRDAAEALSLASEVYLIYDPFVPEDRAHTRRLTGENVRHLHVGHMGHRAIRQLKALGMLQPLIEKVGHGDFGRHGFATDMRIRRRLIDWQRMLLVEAVRRGHKRLAVAATERIALDDPKNKFARRHLRRLRKAQA